MAINWTSLTDEELINRVRTVYPAGTLIAELAARLCVALAEIEALNDYLEIDPDAILLPHTVPKVYV